MTLKEFNNCVDLYADSLYRFILKNVRDEEHARDIVQDSFEKMWIKAESVSFQKSKSYLFTTGYHTMIDLLRRESKRTGFNEYDHLVDDHVYNEYNDVQQILNEALAKLSEIQRSVILLRDYEGYSYEEIGEITGLNESQVKVYIYRARMFLKNYIGKLENVI